MKLFGRWAAEQCGLDKQKQHIGDSYLGEPHHPQTTVMSTITASMYAVEGKKEERFEWGFINMKILLELDTNSSILYYFLELDIYVYRFINIYMNMDNIIKSYNMKRRE